MFVEIITGVVGGLAYSLSGLAAKDKREGFDWKKMAPTLVIAGVVGGVAGFTGQDYGVVANGVLALGVTAFVQKIWQAIQSKFL